MAYEQLKLDNQLCFRLYSASRLIVQSYQPYLSPLGLTYTQYLVMMVLWESDAPLTVSAISERLKLESNTLTPLIKRMEASGLLTRTKGREDGRQTLVGLTPKGRALEQEAAQVPLCLSDKLHGCKIEDSTLLQLIPLVDELIAKLSPAE